MIKLFGIDLFNDLGKAVTSIKKSGYKKDSVTDPEFPHTFDLVCLDSAKRFIV